MNEIIDYIMTALSYVIQGINAFAVNFVGSNKFVLFGFPLYQWFIGIFAIVSIFLIILNRIEGNDYD